MKENSEADFKSATEQTAEKKLFIETYGCQMNVADSEGCSFYYANGRICTMRLYRRRRCYPG